MVVKIGIIKSGNIGTSPVLDLLLDERADRPNIDVRVFGSGAKMNPEQVEDVVPKVDQSVSSLVQTQEHLDQLKQENCYLKKTSLLLSLVMHQVKVKKMKWMNKA
mgnify:CR=1 FL=1